MNKTTTILALALVALPLAPGASAADLSDCISLQGSVVSDSPDGCVGLLGTTLGRTTSASTSIAVLAYNINGCTVRTTWAVSGSSTSTSYTWDGHYTYITNTGQAGVGQPGAVSRTVSNTIVMLPGTYVEVKAQIRNDHDSTDMASRASKYWCLPVGIPQ